MTATITAKSLAREWMPGQCIQGAILWLHKQSFSLHTPFRLYDLYHFVFSFMICKCYFVVCIVHVQYLLLKLVCCGVLYILCVIINKRL